MEKEILATVNSVLSDVSLLTLDRINALTKGHGGLNIAALSSANAITNEILRGESIQLLYINAPELPVDRVVKIGVEAAKEAGACPANAALITATILYLAGSQARAGTPAANRKLGALARIVAGADRGGVINIPTPKMGNRLTGFPAVKALYDAVKEKKLTQVDGRTLPMGVAGGAVLGHARLGEDIVFPEIAENGARIATKAMMDAYAGVGLPPSQMICAILGAAAVLEIVHPDAFMGEMYGPFGTDSAYLVGKSAAETAGLPSKLHLKGTNEEFDTAKLVGNFGLILKDIGAPTVVGMITFNDFMWGFQESDMGLLVPNAPGPINPPLMHVPIQDIAPTLRTLIKNGGDEYKTADMIAGYIGAMSMDPESRHVAMYITARKAEEVRKGPITSSMILATQGVTLNAVYRRAKKVYEEVRTGKGVKEIARSFDEEKKLKAEKRGSELFSMGFGTNVEVKLTEIRPQARRTEEFTKDYWSFDAYIDAEVNIGENKFKMEGLLDKVVPDAVLNKKTELNQAIWAATVVMQELMYSGSSILNIVVPAVMGACMGLNDKEAAKQAKQGAYLNNTVPSASKRAQAVARRAKRLMKELEDYDFFKYPIFW
ncbi:MAG: hypothetical protein ACUVXA_04500 [Candidatus Jordarchaeum sp.]|uniref:hypothetical protein n=1 Tax=Candidatus Jordarchaeum sp. TaxID=2823881 RepID=UPI00404B907F